MPPKRDNKRSRVEDEDDLDSMRKVIEGGETISLNDMAKVNFKMLGAISKLADEMKDMKSSMEEELKKMKTDIMKDLGRQMKEQEEKTDALEDRVEDMETMGTNNRKKADDLRKEVDQLKQEMKKITKRTLALEIKEAQNVLMIRNLDVHKGSNNGKETLVQSREQLNQFLTELGIKDEIGDYECYRMKQTDEQKKRGPPIMKLNLRSTRQVQIFFKALATIGKSCKVSVHEMIPNSLMDNYRTLAKEASEIRRSDDGVKTRVRREGTELVLLAKKGDDTRFNFIKRL